jgi:hypothetical protein
MFNVQVNQEKKASEGIFYRGNLVIARDTDTIVLVNKIESFSSFSGSVLSSGSRAIGDYTDVWGKQFFEQFHGEIIIKEE